MWLDFNSLLLRRRVKVMSCWVSRFRAPPYRMHVFVHSYTRRPDDLWILLFLWTVVIINGRQRMQTDQRADFPLPFTGTIGFRVSRADTIVCQHWQSGPSPIHLSDEIRCQFALWFIVLEMYYGWSSHSRGLLTCEVKYTTSALTPLFWKLCDSKVPLPLF